MIAQITYSKSCDNLKLKTNKLKNLCNFPFVSIHIYFLFMYYATPLIILKIGYVMLKYKKKNYIYFFIEIGQFTRNFFFLNFLSNFYLTL